MHPDTHAQSIQRMNVVLIFLACYFVPLALLLIHRTLLKVYLAAVLAGVLYLSFDTYQALQAETDCGAGCALAVGAIALSVMCAVAGSGFAVLSALALNKWRAKRNGAAKI